MVIQCEQCQTIYNFDASQLHNGSAQVRCARCQQVFTVTAASAITLAASTAAQPTPQPPPQPSASPTWAPAAAEPAAPAPTEPSPLRSEPSEEFSFDTAEPFSFSEPEPAAEDSNALWPTAAPQEPPTPPDSAPEQEFRFESLDERAAEPAPAQVAAPLRTDNESAPPPTPPKSAPRAPVAKQKSSKLLIFLLLLILTVGGIYGYFYLTLGTTDVMKMIQSIQQQLLPAAPKPQGEIKVDSSRSFYITNSIEGPLFVIEGTASNGFTEARSEMSVAATLYKKKGEPLRRQVAYCGNLISAQDLENASMATITAQMNNPFGAALSNTNVAPRQSLQFMIVFNNLPEDLNEFSVEAAGSKAAARP